MQAAKRLFLEEGIQHATMRRIAADVGISSTALYVYFPDKLAILDAIAEAMFEALPTAFAQLQAADAASLPGLRAGLRAYVDLALSRPDEYRLAFDARSAAAAPERRPFRLLQHMVADLMHQGVFAPGDAPAVTEALWACVHGAAMLLLSQPGRLETSADTLIDAVLNAAVKGFEADN